MLGRRASEYALRLQPDVVSGGGVPKPTDKENDQ
jgi:hypothetical protein